MIGNTVQTLEFANRSMAVVDHQGDRWVPVPDVASAIGVPAETIRSLISRNREEFEDFFTTANMNTVAGRNGIRGNPHTGLLNYQGVIGVIMFVSRDRMENPEARQNVLTFRRWALTTLRRAMEGQGAPTPDSSPSAPSSPPSPLDLKAADRAIRLVREARLSLPKGTDLWPLIRSAYSAVGLDLPERLETVHPAGRAAGQQGREGGGAVGTGIPTPDAAPTDHSRQTDAVPASPHQQTGDRPALLVSLAREELAANTHRILGHPGCKIDTASAAATSSPKPLGALKKVPGASGYMAVVPGQLTALVNARLKAAGQLAASAMEIGRALREVGTLQEDGRQHSTRIGRQPVNAWRLPVEWMTADH